ncbi:hypothetical protein BRX37_21330 [Sphingomonas sp. S-NIH.Pt3_0716]|nr:hypothetical protein BRX37_21330 [Sphingomonas sp. S-NIH.Pt3_0716]
MDGPTAIVADLHAIGRRSGCKLAIALDQRFGRAIAPQFTDRTIGVKITGDPFPARIGQQIAARLPHGFTDLVTNADLAIDIERPGLREWREGSSVDFIGVNARGQEVTNDLAYRHRGRSINRGADDIGRDQAAGLTTEAIETFFRTVRPLTRLKVEADQRAIAVHRRGRVRRNGPGILKNAGDAARGAITVILVDPIILTNQDAADVLGLARTPRFQRPFDFRIAIQCAFAAIRQREKVFGDLGVGTGQADRAFQTVARQRAARSGEHLFVFRKIGTIFADPHFHGATVERKRGPGRVVKITGNQEDDIAM